MTTFQPAVVSLGLSDADLTGRNVLVITHTAVDYPSTIPLPTAYGVSTYYWNAYAQNAVSADTHLINALNAIEVTIASGAVWTSSWGSPADGYYTLTRKIGAVITPANVTLAWTDGSTTVDSEIAQWFGFDNSADLVTTTGQITTDWQAGRMWLPDRFPRRFERTPRYTRVTNHNRYTGTVGRFEVGSWYEYVLEFERLSALFVYADRATKSDYLATRPGVVSGDPNVSLEGGIWRWLGSTDSPLRVYPSRAALSTYTEGLSPFEPEQLDTFASMFTEERPAPQRYTARMTFSGAAT